MQLAWEPADFWGTNVSVAATKVSIGGEEVQLGAAATARAWQFAAPDADDAATAVLSYVDSQGGVCKAFTNELVLLRSVFSGSASIMTATNAPGWRAFRSETLPVAYSPDWVPFGVTNDVAGSFSVTQGALSDSAEIPSHPGWRMLRFGDGPWNGKNFDLDFLFADSPFENEWCASIHRAGGVVIIVQ